MTRDEILLDLYTRVTSRKFLGFLLVVFFAVWNWWAGRLTDVEFQQALTAAFTIYGFIEGASDFAAMLPRSRNPAPTTEVTVGNTEVNQNDNQPPTPRAPKRVRPSRAKPKPSKTAT